jgi:polysaccharide export outer membrane protein
MLLVFMRADGMAQRQQRDPGVAVGYSPVEWATKNPIQNGFYRLPGISSDYRLGPGDELEIFISGYSAKSISVRVSNTAEISIPLVGDMTVTDQTTTELENRIVAALVERQLLRAPEVLVNVAEHVARPIYVLGEVDNPGQYMMSQQLTLMEAIFLAGGLDFTAGEYGYLHRRTTETEGPPPSVAMLAHADVPLPGHAVTRIDLQPLKEGRTLEPDIPLHAGDVIAIPRRQVEMFYVIGDVVHAGGFEVPAQRSLRASQALAYAGGPRRTAKTSAGLIVRIDASGQRQQIPIDFKALLRGTRPDVDVKPNDVIFIPGAGAKNFANGILGVVPAIIQAALIF